MTRSYTEIRASNEVGNMRAQDTAGVLLGPWLPLAQDDHVPNLKASVVNTMLKPFQTLCYGLKLPSPYLEIVLRHA